MSFIDTLLDVGEAVVSTVVPHGDKLVNIIKRVSGSDDIDPKTITGNELAKVVEGLSSEDTARIHESYNAVIMNANDNYRKVQEAFSEADKTGKSERGKIAKYLAVASIFWITGLLLIIGWVSIETGTQPDAWLVTALLFLPYTIIGAYFGVKSSEIKNIMDLRSPMTGTIKDAPLKMLFGKMMGK